MKRRTPTILIILLFLIGTVILLYPLIGRWYNRTNQATIIENYDQTMVELEAAKCNEIRQRAQEYNQSLLGNVILSDPFDTSMEEQDTSEYNQLLNMNHDGMMGYIDIPEIDIQLPVFHGTSEEVLGKTAGHLENTSLPIGGSGTHAVISAHTGLPIGKYFDDLIELEEGDRFYLKVLDETLAYQVDQIKVVEPADTSDLVIDREQDYVTLVTCTPYGVNSHRLLVRGTRIPYTEGEEVIRPEKKAFWWWRVILIGGLCIQLPVIYVLVKKRRNRKKNRRTA